MWKMVLVALLTGWATWGDTITLMGARVLHGKFRAARNATSAEVAAVLQGRTVQVPVPIEKISVVILDETEVMIAPDNYMIPKGQEKKRISQYRFRVQLRNGKSMDARVLEVTDQKVVLSSGEYPREEVKVLRRQ
jgi:hypothetical protein